MDIQRHDYIGEVTFFLTDLMCSSTHKYDALLKGPRNMGRIIVRGAHFVYLLTYLLTHSLTH